MAQPQRVTFGGIPIVVDEACPEDTTYLIPARSEAELAQLREILGDHLKATAAGAVVIKNIRPKR